MERKVWKKILEKNVVLQVQIGGKTRRKETTRKTMT
jgi:hypothetical protein